MDPETLVAQALIAENNQKYREAVVKLKNGLDDIGQGVIDIEIAGINPQDQEEIVKLAAALIIPEMLLTQRTDILDALKKISPTAYGAPPHPPMKQYHIVKLLKQTLEQYPALKMDAAMYSDFCLRFIQEFTKLPSAISRFIAFERMKEILGPARGDLIASEYFETFDGIKTHIPSTIAEIYANLDSEPVRINRKNLVMTQLPPLPIPPQKTGQEVLQTFDNMIGTLELDDTTAPNFLSICVIDEAIKETTDNKVKVTENIEFARQYLKVLYDLPREGPARWTPKESEKSFLKQGIEVILDALGKTDDPSIKANNTALLIQGLVHCPAGQKEGIDTVIKIVIYGVNSVSTNLPEQIKILMAVQGKEDLLERIVRQPEHSENNHISAFYKQRLPEALGIFSSSGTFEERLPVRTDNFEGNVNLVLAMFFMFVTPQTLQHILFNAVENEADKKLQAETNGLATTLRTLSSDPRANQGKKELQDRVDLMKKEVKSPSEERAHQLRIAGIEGLIKNMIEYKIVRAEEIQRIRDQKEEKEKKLKQNRKTRFISVGRIIEFLSQQYSVVDMTDSEKRTFFSLYLNTDNPEAHPMPLLTEEGAMRLLEDLGYIIDDRHDSKAIRAQQESLAQDLVRRKEKREEENIITEFNSLRTEIETAYQKFKKTLKTKVKDISTSTLFLQSLVESLKVIEGFITTGYADEDTMDRANTLAKQIAAILTQGHGVGGLKLRTATKPEKAIMKEAVDLLAKRINLKALKLYINQGPDLKTRDPKIIKHEQILWALANLAVLKETKDWDKKELDEKVGFLLSKLGNGILSEIPSSSLEKLVK
ncbi:MAG: hypothetical protein K2W94_07080 [Alphaproteobacteria bacterium]|nr:hypothetical protein [Alphaproteobacteria bacterium]